MSGAPRPVQGILRDQFGQGIADPRTFKRNLNATMKGVLVV